MCKEELNYLTTTNWITIISVFIVVAGWFINGYLKRRQDISNDRLKFRLEALNYCTKLLFYLEKSKDPLDEPDFDDKLSHAELYLYFFGTAKEYKSFINLKEYIFNSQKEKMFLELNKLKNLIKQDISKSLKL